MLAALQSPASTTLVDLDASPALLLRDVDAAFSRFRVVHARRYVSAAEERARRAGEEAPVAYSWLMSRPARGTGSALDLG